MGRSGDLTENRCRFAEFRLCTLPRPTAGLASLALSISIKQGHHQCLFMGAAVILNISSPSGSSDKW